MKSEPVLIVLGVLEAVLFGISQVPLPGPWNLLATGAAVALAGVVARSQVSPAASK